MSTVGELQLRLNKLPQGANSDRVVLLGIINDVTQRYVNSYQWSRLSKTASLLTSALYETGTISVTNGSTAITGTDTVWTSAMTGRRIRISGRNETYVFTYTSATTGNLDRGYEGDTDTAATYQIFQSVYALPADVDQIDSVEVPSLNRDLDQESPEYLDKLATDRWALGHPMFYTTAPDITTAGVQYPAIELYPVPDIAEGLIVRYRQSVALFTAPSDTFLPWIQFECIVAGCEAELHAAKGDIGLYQVKEGKFQMLLKDAIDSDSDRQYPDEMMMDERYTWHRTIRALGHDRFSRHWWQLRNSN